MTVHQQVELIEKHLAELPHRETFYRGVPISNFSHDALVIIAGQFLKMYEQEAEECQNNARLLSRAY